MGRYPGWHVRLSNCWVAIYLTFNTRRRLEDRNRELEGQVTLGRIRLQTHEGELKAAHDIQAHLLPAEIPQIGGLKISCAWQPARSVGGDYFDVLALPPGRIAVLSGGCTASR